MKRSRFYLRHLVAFIISNISTMAIHGFALAADYEPFEGSAAAVRWGGGCCSCPWSICRSLCAAACGSTCA